MRAYPKQGAAAMSKYVAAIIIGLVVAAIVGVLATTLPGQGGGDLSTPLLAAVFSGLATAVVFVSMAGTDGGAAPAGQRWRRWRGGASKRSKPPRER
jgi:hypothetical protein